MEDVGSSSRWLAQAFGRRLREGADEWRGVAGVVRSSFLLLYGELRRQNQQLRLQSQQLQTNALLGEQLSLVREELRLTQAELRQLRDVPVHQCQPCRCCRSSKPSETEREDEQLRRRVDELQRRLTRTRRTHLESEEIVVRAAEQHARRLKKLQAKVDALRHTVGGEVDARLCVVETHVEATQRVVKRLYKQQLQLEQSKYVNHQTQTDRDGVEDAKSGFDEIEARRSKAERTRLPTVLSSKDVVLFSHDEAQPSVLHEKDAWPHATVLSGLERDDNDDHNDDANDNDRQESIDDKERTTPATPPRMNSVGHASLRLRYHRERKRQLGRLDRLRAVPYLPTA